MPYRRSLSFLKGLAVSTLSRQLFILQRKLSSYLVVSPTNTALLKLTIIYLL